MSDTEKSLAFYNGILGLSIDKHRPDLGYPGAWLNIGDQQLHLLQVPNPDKDRIAPAHGGRDHHVAFKVNNVSELAAALADAGIEFNRSRSGRAALFCRDPDGNALEFIEQSQD